jgi:hypothetical protein
VQLPHPEVLSRVARIECIAEATLLVRPLKSLDPRKFRGHIFRRHLNNVQQGTPLDRVPGGSMLLPPSSCNVGTRGGLGVYL